MSSRDALIGLAYDVNIFESQIARKDGPLLRVLDKAKAAGIEALEALVACDIVSDPEAARGYQSEVRRYMELIDWTAEFAVEGKEAEDHLHGDDVEEVRRLVNPDPPDETGD